MSSSSKGVEKPMDRKKRRVVVSSCGTKRRARVRSRLLQSVGHANVSKFTATRYRQTWPFDLITHSSSDTEEPTSPQNIFRLSYDQPNSISYTRNHAPRAKVSELTALTQRHGHVNEQLEKSYRFMIPHLIENMTPLQSYCDRLVQDGVLTTSEQEEITAIEHTRGRGKGVQKVLALLMNKGNSGVSVLHNVFLYESISQTHIRMQAIQVQEYINGWEMGSTPTLETERRAIAALLDGTDKEVLSHLDTFLAMNVTYTLSLLSKLTKFGALSPEEEERIREVRGLRERTDALHTTMMKKENGASCSYLIAAASENPLFWRDMADVIKFTGGGVQTTSREAYLVDVKTKLLLEKADSVYTPDVIQGDKSKFDYVEKMFDRYEAKIRGLKKGCVTFQTEFTEVRGLLQCWIDCHDGVLEKEIGDMVITPEILAQAGGETIGVDVHIPEERFLHALIHLLSAEKKNDRAQEESTVKEEPSINTGEPAADKPSPNNSTMETCDEIVSQSDAPSAFDSYADIYVSMTLVSRKSSNRDTIVTPLHRSYWPEGSFEAVQEKLREFGCAIREHTGSGNVHLISRTLVPFSVTNTDFEIRMLSILVESVLEKSHYSLFNDYTVRCSIKGIEIRQLLPGPEHDEIKLLLKSLGIHTAERWLYSLKTFEFGVIAGTFRRLEPLDETLEEPDQQCVRKKDLSKSVDGCDDEPGYVGKRHRSRYGPYGHSKMTQKLLAAHDCRSLGDADPNGLPTLIVGNNVTGDFHVHIHKQCGHPDSPPKYRDALKTELDSSSNNAF